jgi:hypothetical protein
MGAPRRMGRPALLQARLVLSSLVLLAATGMVSAGCSGTGVSTTTPLGATTGAAAQTTTSASAATPPATQPPGATATSTETPTTATTSTPSTAASELPTKPAAQLLQYRYDGSAGKEADPVRGWRVADISALTGNGANSTRIVGDAFRFDEETGTVPAHIVAVGESGDLLTFAPGAGAGEWTADWVPSGTGKPLRELLSGPMSASPLAVTGMGKTAVLHVFAVDSGDNLLHFSLAAGQQWKAENASQATGAPVHSLGGARATDKSKTLEACALGPDGDLLFFRLAAGGSWTVERPGAPASSAAHKQAAFIIDPLGQSQTAIAAGSRDDHLLLYRRAGNGTWTLEDVTKETASAGIQAVTLGGWLASWDWTSGAYWTASLFKHPLALITKEGRFLLLQRASAAGPWSVTDIPVLSAVTFSTEGGGASIVRVCPPQAAFPREVHLAGVDSHGNLIHFWRDAKGTWRSEDYTKSSGARFAYPIGCFPSPYKAAATEGAGGATGRFFLGLTPSAELVQLTSPDESRLFPGSGVRLRGPALTWGPAGVTNIVLAGRTSG